MAYQTISGDFFDHLHNLLTNNKVKETIELLSDASSSDPTLNGDLKFLKLRANKKLMAPAGGMAMGSPKQQLQDVVMLVAELKKAHARRNVSVSTLTQATASGINTNQVTKNKSGKKRAIWPWVLLGLLALGGAGGYFMKDKIMGSEFVQNFTSEASQEPTSSNKNTTSTKPTSKPKPKSSNNTSTKVKPSTTSLGAWYIQVASYASEKQAESKRKRVAMSFDRSISLKKSLGSGKYTYRVIIPGFDSESDAKRFKKESRVENLYRGAFVKSYNNECGSLTEISDHLYECD